MQLKPIALLITLLAGSVAQAGTIWEPVPDGIKCTLEPLPDRPGGLIVLIVSSVIDDGKVIYHSIGRLAVTVIFDPEGTPIGGAKALCDGKTLQQLIDDGQAFDF
ncbi:MAG: hypothetical protein AB3N23_08600 [Paracoccaceae bacterium]